MYHSKYHPVCKFGAFEMRIKLRKSPNRLASLSTPLNALTLCDQAFVVPSPHTAHIQECHIMVGHILMELIEDMMLANGTVKKF